LAERINALPVAVTSSKELSEIRRAIDNLPASSTGLSNEIYELRIQCIRKQANVFALVIAEFTPGVSSPEQTKRILAGFDYFDRQSIFHKENDIYGLLSDLRKEFRQKLAQADAIESKERQKKVQADVAGLIKKHQDKIARLGFTKNYLQAMIYLNFLGQNVQYQTLEGWLALVYENSNPTQVTKISLPNSNNQGVSVKLAGKPSVGVLFTYDVGELYLSHAVISDQAERLQTAPAQMRMSRVVVTLAEKEN